MSGHRWLYAVLAVAVVSFACRNAVSKEDSIKRGDAFIEQGKVREAVIEYRVAIRADQADGTSRRKLGLALARLGDVEGARSNLVRAADLLPNDDAVQL